VKFLLERGARPRAEALRWAILHKHARIARMLEAG
jgi:hypothetical protein